jgi:hypothetical protein
MATISEMSKYFQERYDLPSNWKVYAWECIPEYEYTHMQLTGCLTDTFKREPRKGQTKYTREMERTFVLSNAEVEAIGEQKPVSRIEQLELLA